jgi:RNA polymerase sigma-70 factor (ECF subfamily)
MTSTTTTTANQPDDQVLKALAHDLDTGFVAMFNAYRAAVFTATLRVSGRWADAEDLTAEAFLRAYRALSTYPEDRIRALRPRSWLLTIALNLFRSGAHGPPCVPLEAARDSPDPRHDVQREVADRETDRELAAALAALPEDQRISVVLRHIVGLSVPDIADVVGRPEGTVKSQVSRGLARLRALLPSDLLEAC